MIRRKVKTVSLKSLKTTVDTRTRLLPPRKHCRRVSASPRVRPTILNIYIYIYRDIIYIYIITFSIYIYIYIYIYYIPMLAVAGDDVAKRYTAFARPAARSSGSWLM